MSGDERHGTEPGTGHDHDEPGHDAHGHDHGHGHDHTHDHPHPHGSDHGDDDVDGREARKAKDAPGRHDTDYYGAPGGLGTSRKVTPGQGDRSFAGRGARKRPL